MTQSEKITAILIAMSYPLEEGNTLEEIQAIETRLKTSLPPALRDFYLQMGKHTLFKNQQGYAYNLTPVEQLIKNLYEYEGESYIPIFSDDSGYYQSLSIKKSTFDKDVIDFVYYNDGLGEANLFNYTHEEFSEELVEIVFRNIYLRFNQFIWLTSSDIVTYISSQFPKIPFVKNAYGNKDFVWIGNTGYAHSPYLLAEVLRAAVNQTDTFVIHSLDLYFEDNKSFSTELLKGIPIEGLKITLFGKNEVYLSSK